MKEDNCMNDREIQKKIYTVLYCYSMIGENYNSGDKLNVLIKGKNNVAIEAFKAVFWCGQVDVKEDILFISVDEVHEQELKKQMPGYDFESKQYATVNFIDFEANENDYNYVLDCKENEIVVKPIGKTFYFDDKNDADFKAKQTALERIAANVNYAYNGAIGSYNDFRAMWENEEDTKNNHYNTMSSLASALHICYKEKIYKNCFKNNEYKDLSTMIRNAKKAMMSADAANKDFDIYKKMVALEHIRWNAYMLTEGWGCPSKMEFYEFAYKDDNDHRNKGCKLHPCLCPGNTENPFQLSQNPKLWEKNDRGLSELDKFSINNHKLLCNLCNQENIKKIIEEYIVDFSKYVKCGFKDLKDEYLAALGKLLSPNAYWGTNRLYEKALSDLKAAIGFSKERDEIFYKEINEKTYKKVIQTINLFKKRNLKTDYSYIDSELVDMIPFCLWYGEKYETSITISNGLLYEDVIVPSLLAAKNVYIYIPTQNIDAKDYEETLKRYFNDEHTNVKVRAVNMNNKKKLDNAIDIDHVLEECDKNKIIFNVSKNANSFATIYLGNQAEKFGIDIVQYDHYKGVIDLKNGNVFYTEFAKRKLMLDDAIQLTNGEIKDKNHKDELQSREIYENILYPLINNEECSFNTELWSGLQLFFQKHKKNPKDKENPKEEDLYDVSRGVNGTKNDKEKYIDYLEKKEIISIDAKAKDTKIDYSIIDHKYDSIFGKAGTAFEGFLYYKIYDCGIFDDIKMGINMYWNFGAPISDTINNEVDIALTLGMKMFFVSCKASNETDSKILNNWLYEIYSVSERFNAIPIMAVLADLSNSGYSNFIRRAENMGISILDEKTILNEYTLREALTKVSKGEVFIRQTIEKNENK